MSFLITRLPKTAFCQPGLSLLKVHSYSTFRGIKCSSYWIFQPSASRTTPRPSDKVKDQSVKTFKLESNKHPYASKGEAETKVVRQGNKVHVYMTAIRSHLTPDNIEGVKIGDEVYFHVTNLEQDWDVPHGFAVKGAANGELLVMPGETQTLKWIPDRVGISPIYCTDFCSALHQEMSGYVRVSPAGSKVALVGNTGTNLPAE